jgi:hypothetical protein
VRDDRAAEGAQPNQLSDRHASAIGDRTDLVPLLGRHPNVEALRELAASLLTE